MNRNALVTGASGFIGKNLVKHLVDRGDKVTCLVRRTSDLSELERLDCELKFDDLNDQSLESLQRAVANQDVVYHLAGKTRGLSPGELIKINQGGLERLLSVCRDTATPPTVVYISSLAAAGSSNKPVSESDECNPLSDYGRSKRAAELIAREYCDKVPVSIVRPPIVLGPDDKNGHTLFQAIDVSTLHMVPGFNDNWFSIIHVEDLVQALSLIADKGNRCKPNDLSDGIYYVADEKMVTYSELGHMIARAVGRSKATILRFPKPLVWMIAGFNSFIGHLIRRPLFFNIDKAREATAGSWICSSEKIKNELQFRPRCSLTERLLQTADWYRENGWLKKKPRQRSTQNAAGLEREKITS